MCKQPGQRGCALWEAPAGPVPAFHDFILQAPGIISCTRVLGNNGHAGHPRPGTRAEGGPTNPAWRRVSSEWKGRERRVTRQPMVAGGPERAGELSERMIEPLASSGCAGACALRGVVDPWRKPGWARRHKRCTLHAACHDHAAAELLVIMAQQVSAHSRTTSEPLSSRAAACACNGLTMLAMYTLRPVALLCRCHWAPPLARRQGAVACQEAQWLDCLTTQTLHGPADMAIAEARHHSRPPPSPHTNWPGTAVIL